MRPNIQLLPIRPLQPQPLIRQRLLKPRPNLLLVLDRRHARDNLDARRAERVPVLRGEQDVRVVRDAHLERDARRVVFVGVHGGYAVPPGLLHQPPVARGAVGGGGGDGDLDFKVADAHVLDLMIRLAHI